MIMDSAAGMPISATPDFYNGRQTIWVRFQNGCWWLKTPSHGRDFPRFPMWNPPEIAPRELFTGGISNLRFILEHFLAKYPPHLKTASIAR
jgi:hypothetical protein